MRDIKILLIGPLPPPVTGVSLANQVVSEYLPKQHNIQLQTINTGLKVLKEDIGKFNLKKTLFYTKQYSQLGKIFKVDKVYATPGQTFFGVLKYYPYFLISKITGKEIIFHVHGNYLGTEYQQLSGIKKKLFKHVVSMSDKGIVLSKSLKTNLSPFLPENKIYVLKNFAEDFLFDTSIKKDFSKLKIIYLSNLMKEKGILDLLNALIILKEKNINFEAKIAGGMDAFLKPEIEKKLKTLNQQVEYLGIVKGEEKKQLLSWGNIFVFPTYYQMEGQPISIFEAMATGNIILTTRHAGIPDIFEEEKNGFYIEKKSPESIANKLIELKENLPGYQYISENNQTEAQKNYRVQSFIDNLYQILNA